MTDDEYFEKAIAKQKAYQLGLTLAIQEIEDMESDSPLTSDARFYLRMYRQALGKTDRQSQTTKLRAEKDMLTITGRGYLAGDIVRLDTIVDRLLNG